jgi:hypothetical protein
MGQKVKQYGGGYNGPDSTKPTQAQESDVANEGGTAPGGIVAFMGAASQWSSSNAANRNNFPTGDDGPMSPEEAAGRMAKMAAGQSTDGAPDGSGNVPINPGINPGKNRAGTDDTPPAADDFGQGTNDPTANNGRPMNNQTGRNRGQSPEIPNQTRGRYRP